VLLIEYIEFTICIIFVKDICEFIASEEPNLPIVYLQTYNKINFSSLDI